MTNSSEDKEVIGHLYEVALDYVTMLQDIREGKPVSVDVDNIASSLSVISEACKTYSFLNRGDEL